MQTLPSSPKLLRRSLRLAGAALRAASSQGAPAAAPNQQQQQQQAERAKAAAAPRAKRKRRQAGKEELQAEPQLPTDAAAAAAASAVAPPVPQSRRRAAKQGGTTRELEEQLWAQGFHTVAGVDEAGRGPLAGPVVAAACCIPPGVSLEGLDDSKKLTERRRESLYEQLTQHPEIQCSVAPLLAQVAGVEEIDAEGSHILRATLAAMARAVAALPAGPPDFVLVDGNQRPPVFCRARGELTQSFPPDFVLVDGNQRPPGLDEASTRTVVRGDAQSTVIAAASILAKVTRDRLMVAYAETWPQYGFEQHKGYGTQAHVRALREHGPCPIHRRSFEPLKGWLRGGEVPAPGPAPLDAEAAVGVKGC